MGVRVCACCKLLEPAGRSQLLTSTDFPTSSSWFEHACSCTRLYMFVYMSVAVIGTFVYMMVIAICLHMQICSCVEKLTLVLTILLFNTSFVSHLLILGKKTKLYYWLLILFNNTS